MKIKKRNVFIFVMIFSFLLFGCSSKTDEGDSEQEVQEAAKEIVDAVHQDLTAKDQENNLFALSAEQLAAIRSSQSTEALNANLSSSEETGKAAAGIVKGTLIALGLYSNEELGGATSDTKESSKVEIVKVVNQKIMDILKNKPGSQPFSDSIKMVFANIVANFGSSGLTQMNLVAASGELAINTLTHAQALEMDADAIAGLAIELAKSGVSSLGSDGAGLLGKLVPEAAEKIITSIVEGLQKAGVGNDAIVAKIADIVDAAVVALGDIPNLPPEDLGLSIKSVEKGLNKGLEAIGLDSVQIAAQEDTIKDAVTAAVKKLADKDTAISLADKVLQISAEGAKELVDNISAELFSIDSTTGLELSEAQVKKIKDDIQAKVDATSDRKLGSIIPLIFKEAKESINALAPALSGREKIDALKTVVEGSVAYLAGKVTDEEFGDKNLSDSLKIIAENSITPLLVGDMTGDPGVFKEMTKALIKPLDLVPMGKTSIADAARVIVEGIVSNIDEIGLSKSDQSAALNNTLNGAVKAAQKGKFTLEQLQEAEGKIAAGAVESLIENQKEELKGYLKAGDPSSDASADLILENIADQALDAMKEAGALDVPELADDIVEGAFDALKKDSDPQTEDLDAKQVGDALDKAAEGVEKSLEEEAKADDNKVDENEKNKIDEAVKDMGMKTDELLAQLTPVGTPDLLLSGGAISVNEDSTVGQSIGALLDGPPEKNIVVAIESKDTDQGTVSPATLTFGVDNWFTPQEVKVTSVHNGLREGNITYPVTFTTDSGARKTVMITDVDDDVVGLDIKPFGAQLYTAAYGSPVTFRVRLRSKPFDNIEVNWALVEGKGKAPGNKDPAAATTGKKMTFAPAAWDVYQKLIVEPAALDITEHVGVSFSSLVVKSVNGNDTEYPVMDVQTLAMVVLKALKLEKFELDPPTDTTSAVIDVTFKDDLFVNTDTGELDEDVKLIYEKGMVDQTFDMKYASNQNEPQCISTTIAISGDVTPDDGLVTPPFNFSLAFYNTTKESAEIAVAKWLGSINVDSTTGVCVGDASAVITCNYTNADAEGASFQLGKNSIFSPEGVGNTTLTPDAGISFSDPGPDSPTPPTPNPDDPSTDIKITFKYHSMVEGEKKMVKFKSLPGQETTKNGIQAGFWTLDSWSANLTKIKVSASDTKGLGVDTGPEPYGSDRHHYIKIP